MQGIMLCRCLGCLSHPRPSMPYATPFSSALHRLACLLILIVTCATVASAQAGTGTIDGIARSADDSTVIPFALVRLLPVDSAGMSGAPLLQRATNANGRFFLTGVAAGRYRLQLARIGYRPLMSPVVE